MSNNLGSSVGVWNENQIASLETGFSNASGFFSSDYLRGNPRTVRFKLGYSEFNKRKNLYLKFTREMGLNSAQLNDFWSKWLIKGNSKSDGFEQFVKEQLLIQQAKEREEAELLARLKEEEKKKAISDSNLFPPDETELNPIDPLTDDELKSNYNTKPIVTPKKSNLLIYGVIGVVALVGIIILIKRK
jgi:hypothetical protein